METHVQLVLQESTRHREDQHSPTVIARTAKRASMGMLQDKPLKHPARPVSLVSTGWEQEDPVKHPARHVPRTRTRLLRALLRRHAVAIQATEATPGQGLAQRA